MIGNEFIADANLGATRVLELLDRVRNEGRCVSWSSARAAHLRGHAINDGCIWLPK